MIVITQRYAEIGRPSSQVRQQSAHAPVVVRNDVAIPRPFIDDLEVQPAGVAQEAGIAQVQVEVLLLVAWVEPDESARQGDECQLVVLQNLA